ncbi:helix-turn-helix domain-containing protein [Chitinophaga sp. sic0106]|uniref:AraC family transcriptional regulator n=1 Tax=Chitinophaga sp. sic0106 TaxID=2854785 RepID=UPI001C45DCE1|nr:helix-turn-helix domain-containing protein [Chitinophaga sp. sic0106]MBV7530911.1 helix-turn-helix domain-containing protein [Chitinophaga sp. sic0106]
MAKQIYTHKGLPHYTLANFRHLHREPDDSSSFGYNNISPEKKIKGFEIYSSEGLVPAVGPLKSDFYRMSITLSGGVDVQLGLEQFRHQPGTISFTYPGQVFSKSNIQPETFGYYALFEADFLGSFLPPDQFQEEFPFFNVNGQLFIQLTTEEITQVAAFVARINEEVQEVKAGRENAVRMYFYLLLLEIKRSYIAQGLHLTHTDTRTGYLIPKFHKLVSQYFLQKRKVADYAAMLGVTPNHLNRTIKDATGHTASEAISTMLIRESKALLRYTDDTISQISFQLDFSDPASFTRFFREQTGRTPLDFRKNA